MIRHIDKHVKEHAKIILIISGLITSGLGIISIFPEFVLKTMFDLDFYQNYSIIIKHWSMSVAIAGIFLIISAFKKEWRIPIMLYSIIEKIYLVLLCIIALKYPYGKAFLPIIYVDTLLCILLAHLLKDEFRKKY